MPEHTASRASPHRIAALVLAAGRSSRFGSSNKLLAELDGRPIVGHAVDAVAAAGLRPVIVVTGAEPESVRQGLTGYDVVFVHNPRYAEGLSTSLRCGIAALPQDIDALLVCLADMPAITADHIGRLVGRFDPAQGRCIGVPTYHGKRGNPVLWDKRFLLEMSAITGDIGARELVATHAKLVYEVEMPDRAVLFDIDTPADLAAAARER
jgi:molybdenum cofactor cytidylyltransferase